MFYKDVILCSIKNIKNNGTYLSEVHKAQLISWEVIICIWQDMKNLYTYQNKKTYYKLDETIYSYKKLKNEVICL